MSCSRYRCVTKQRWSCHKNKNNININITYIQEQNYSLWKTLTCTATSFTNAYSMSSSSSSCVDLQDIIQNDYEYDMAPQDTNHTINKSNIKSFLDSFSITMKKSIKHCVNQQSVSLQNRYLRHDLQSHDTYKFIANAQQALFEEILAEKIWFLYHFEHNKYSNGIPIHILHKYLHDEYIKYGICDNNNNAKTFKHRLLSLTKLHASYDDFIWLRMHQLPFYNNNSNKNKTHILFNNKCKNQKESNLHKITDEDVIGCNIDRTGRIAWYLEPDNNNKTNDNNLIFFPGIFEPDTIFLSNALNAINELNALLIESKSSHNTHILLQSSHLLQDTKIGFFEQELWRFLTYYPSGGQFDKLMDCCNLFGIPSKDIMRKYLNKYIYSDHNEDKYKFCVFIAGRKCAIEYDKESNYFKVNKRLPLMQQIDAFHTYHFNQLQELKNNAIASYQQYHSLFNSCLSPNCRIFYDVRLLKCVFWGWCHHQNKQIFPKISMFESMANELMDKYSQSVNKSLGGRNTYSLRQSQYEYSLLRQLWFIGIKNNLFNEKKHLQFALKLTDIVLAKNDINWFLSIMQIRNENNINIEPALIYGTLFNIINDIIYILPHKDTANKQLHQLMQILNDCYAKLPHTQHINHRFIQLFNLMSTASDYSALKQIKLSNMNTQFVAQMAHKLNISVSQIAAMHSLYDLMQLFTAQPKLQKKIATDIHIDIVAFHYNLKQRRFDMALETLQHFNKRVIEKSNHNQYCLESALKIITLPSDSKIWRSGTKKMSKNGLTNLQPLKLEIASILNLCICAVSQLPINQNEMANVLAPLEHILEHITKEHGSMKICHDMFYKILSTQELPLPVPLVSKYLHLYAEYDEFLSSPIQTIENILKRYIPPVIISSNATHFDDKCGLKEWSVMSKSDGIDDKLDPFNLFKSDNGYKILPMQIYEQMLKLLHQYSSVHGLGLLHLNVENHGINKAIIECAEFVWRIMEWDGYCGDVNIYNSMLDILCKWDEITAALSLFEQMVGDHKFNHNKYGYIEPNNTTLYILADAMVHPDNITNFVRNIAPQEYKNDLSNKIKHLQHKSWFNIYKHRGQILNDLSFSERSKWVNIQKKYGDIAHKESNELFFAFFPRTQFVMATALNRLEEISAVLNDNASEWLDNLIQCYVIQFLPDYKHIFKVRPHTLRMQIIRQICDSKTRLGFETTATEKVVNKLWHLVQEFRNKYSVKISHSKFQRDCGWTISDLKKLFSVPTLSAFIKADKHNFILTPSFAKSLFSSKPTVENAQDTNEINIIDTECAESKSISELIKLQETINGKPAQFTSQLTVNPFAINIEHDVEKTEEITCTADKNMTNDLFLGNIEWWQSQYQCLRPTLMPQALSAPELSRNAEHCKNTIFCKQINSDWQLFDENKYICNLLESSCNLWTLMHVSSLFYRSFNWNNARLALLRITTELSGRSRPFNDLSVEVYNELLNNSETKLLFQRTLQHLFWLTGQEYIYNYQLYFGWKGYNTIITSLHWIYLMLKMDDKQIGIVHNKYLIHFIKADKSITGNDLCYLLAARIEGGLFNKKNNKNISYVSDTTQAIFDRLFLLFNNTNDIAQYLMDNKLFDTIDRLIHSIKKYPHLICSNDWKYNAGNESVFVSQFLIDLLLSMERKLLFIEKSDGILQVLTRITNNILLIHNYYNENNANNNNKHLNIKEWSELFYDNFHRLTINETLLLLQTLTNIDSKIINCELITKLSFHQFNTKNLNNLSSPQLTQLLQVLLKIDKTESESMPTSLIHNIESIISEQICKYPENLNDAQIKLLEKCLLRFNLNKTQLINAQNFFIQSHKHLTPHWTKFYKIEQNSHDNNNNIIIDEWWKKDK